MSTASPAIDSVPLSRSPLGDILTLLAAAGIAYAVEAGAHAAGWVDFGADKRGLSAIGVAALTAVVLVRRRGGSLADLGFVRFERPATVPLWVGGIVLAFMAAQWLVPALVASFVTVPAPDLSRHAHVEGDLVAAIAMVLVLPLTASIPEEIIFRGFLLERIEAAVGDGRGRAAAAIAGIVGQALVFGSIHFAWGVGGMVVTTIMGLVWGASYVLCGRNLWIVILAHSVGHVLFAIQLYQGTSIVL